MIDYSRGPNRNCKEAGRRDECRDGEQSRGGCSMGSATTGAAAWIPRPGVAQTSPDSGHLRGARAGGLHAPRRAVPPDARGRRHARARRRLRADGPALPPPARRSPGPPSPRCRSCSCAAKITGLYDRDEDAAAQDDARRGAQALPAGDARARSSPGSPAACSCTDDLDRHEALFLWLALAAPVDPLRARSRGPWR